MFVTVFVTCFPSLYFFHISKQVVVVDVIVVVVDDADVVVDFSHRMKQ
jgi:hypothetical protein